MFWDKVKFISELVIQSFNSYCLVTLYQHHYFLSDLSLIIICVKASVARTFSILCWIIHVWLVQTIINIKNNFTVLTSLIQHSYSYSYSTITLTRQFKMFHSFCIQKISANSAQNHINAVTIYSIWLYMVMISNIMDYGKLNLLYYDTIHTASYHA